MFSMTELLMLVASELEMNKNKVVKYEFELNTYFQNMRMFSVTDMNSEDAKREEIFNTRLETPADIQHAYWSIWTLGRSRTFDNLPTNKPITERKYPKYNAKKSDPKE